MLLSPVLQSLRAVKQMNDLERTIHYTRRTKQICGNLTKFVPDNVVLVEPFVGEGDLVSLFPSRKWELYDIMDKGNNVVQDTLLNPPNYKAKWVITNPPFLARNKAKNKTIYEKYHTDDLYKAFLLSILECDGGIVIIPTNFFTDEKTAEVRKKFLSTFKILFLNIFTKPVFDTTTYSVCSFAFERENNTEQNLFCSIDNNFILSPITLRAEYNYRLAGEVYHSLDNIKCIFNRLTENSINFPTKMKLYAIDTRAEKIHISIEDEPYVGKPTDRTYATFTCARELTEEQQILITQRFNDFMTNFREKYHDLPLTNYRDYNRKRISFTFAYKLLSYICVRLYG